MLHAKYKKINKKNPIGSRYRYFIKPINWRLRCCRKQKRLERVKEFKIARLTDALLRSVLASLNDVTYGLDADDIGMVIIVNFYVKTNFN